MDPKIDPSSVEAAVAPARGVPTPSSSDVYRISPAPAADEGWFVPGTLWGGDRKAWLAPASPATAPGTRGSFGEAAI